MLFYVHACKKLISILLSVCFIFSVSLRSSAGNYFIATPGLNSIYELYSGGSIDILLPVSNTQIKIIKEYDFFDSSIIKLFLEKSKEEVLPAFIGFAEEDIQKEGFVENKRKELDEIIEKLRTFLRKRYSKELNAFLQFLESLVSHINVALDEIKCQPMENTNENRAIDVWILALKIENFVDGQIKDSEINARVAELSKSIYQTEIDGNLNLKELDELLQKVAKPYLELFVRFKKESEEKESPFATSIMWTDFHHPVSHWILESPFFSKGLYHFRLSKRLDVQTQLLSSLLINVKEGRITYISDFAPGTNIELRDDIGGGTLMRSYPIEGRGFIRIFDPDSDDFKEFTKQILQKYAEKEYEILQKIEKYEEIIAFCEEILADKNHPRRQGTSESEIREDMEKLRDKLAGFRNELKIAAIPVDKLRIIARERVVAEKVVPDEEAYPLAGIVSYKEIGLSSPLDLLKRIDLVYPVVEQLLLTGKVPEKLQRSLLALPEGERIDPEDLDDLDTPPKPLLPPEPDTCVNNST